MIKRTESDHSTLSWVKQELDDTLKQAAEALNGYAEDSSDRTQLQFCATHLHQVEGILQMLELFGAAMLVEEMEHVAEALLEDAVSVPADALEVLMRAILQTSDYLERIQGGAQDLPILILPLLNDLRAVRGANLLTESALFSPDLEAAAAAPRHQREAGQPLQERARKLRHRYQLGLLGVLREQEPEQGLRQMLAVLDELDQAAGDDHAGTVWWVGSGLVEALAEGGLGASTTVKMLLGQVDRQIKRTVDAGAAPMAEEPPQDLVRNLLYYVGRAEPVGERVSAIQAQYELKDLLLDEQQIEQARAGMFGPNTEILATVAGALKEDLAGVKDGLDLFVRSGGSDTERLQGLPEALRRVADTLGVLGLGLPRQIVQEQTATVERLIADPASVDESALMDVAQALLRVDGALEGLSRQQPAEPASEADAAGQHAGQEPVPYEYRQVFASAINEAIVDISRAKEAIVEFIDSGRREQSDDIRARFASVRGALALLGMEQAGAVVGAAECYLVQRVHDAERPPEGEELDALADAITGIEYYLEAVRDGRSSPERILEVTASSLSRLGFDAAATAPAETVPAAEAATLWPAVEPPSAAADAAEEIVVEPLAEAEDASPASSAVSAADSAEPAAAERPAPPPRSTRLDYELPVLVAEPDPEILEIFLEEAEEVLQTIRTRYPQWRADPQAQDALVTVRRMFHTLKGSGRLAGALQLGELAWSIESLLNRVIDGALEPQAELYQVVEQAIEALPQMIAQLQGGAAPGVDVAAIMQRAERLRDPQAAPPEPSRAEPTELVADTAEAVAGDAVDLELVDSEAVAPEPVDLESVDLESVDLESVDREAVDLEAVDLEAVDLEAVDLEAVDLEAVDLEAVDLEAVDLEAVDLEAVDLEAVDLEAVDLEAVDLEAVDLEAVDLEAVDLESVDLESVDLESVDLEAVDLEAVDLEAVDLEAVDLEAVDLEAVDLESVDLESVTEPQAVDLESVGAESDVPSAEPTGSAETAMDPVLYEIFRKESADHLAAIRAYVAACAATGGDSCAVDEALVRALHTLSGSARMAEVESIARLARSLELHAEARLDAERPLEAADLEILGRGVDLIEQLVAALPDPTAELPDVEPLLAELVARPLLPASLRVEPEPPPAVLASDIDPDLVELFLEEAEDILQFLDTTVQRWEDAPDHAATVAELHRSLHTLKGGARLAGFSAIGNLCHALEGLANAVAEHRVPADDDFFKALHAALDRLAAMVVSARGGEQPAEAHELIDRLGQLRGGVSFDTGPADADVELMEVFLEEAAEILQATEGLLHRWSEAPAEGELLTELQRALHTLKGGARMAGFAPIANLSHNLETLLLALAESRQEPQPALFALLEQVHDRLFALREQAARSEPLLEAVDLLAAIEVQRAALGSGEPSPLPKPEAAATAAAPSDPPQRPKPKGKAAKPAEAAVAQQPAAQQHDVVRVRADLLDNLVNYAGEISIYRARLDQQVGATRFNLTELDQTVQRLREQLRTLEIETEAQILYRYEREHEGEEPVEEAFDPLELDRFSHIQELSRALSESVNDLSSIQTLLDQLSRESETLLLQQSRLNTDLQDGLMRTRMVPFANLVPRLRRIVRQTAQEMGRQAQLKVLGAQGEMDRTVLERVIPPLEHMLRNAVAHGIETPEQRQQAGKPAEGTITVGFAREGADVVIEVADDGRGLNLEAIRSKAIAQGLMTEGAPLSDREVMQFVLEAGFSTAEQVTQIAGRGVGMDVVSSEIKQLGGVLEIDSSAGEGSRFVVRLPFTLAISQALLCQAGEDVYAIPLSNIEGVVRMTRDELEQSLAGGTHDYAGASYEVRSLAQLLNVGEPLLPPAGKRAPIILVQTGDHRLALQVDGLLGNREIVVKSVGPQISTVPGIFGATILADGRVVLILDVSTLVRLGMAAQQVAEELAAAPPEPTATPQRTDKPLVMVVDDSITMRKVATRLLERNNMAVLTAKDGVDAVAALQEQVPDAMLLDIEMPRMDGYELATHMRNDSRLQHVPIIMITSRTGDKHRQRALEIGVDRYLGKPYQESELLQNLREVLAQGRHGG